MYPIVDVHEQDMKPIIERNGAKSYMKINLSRMTMSYYVMVRGRGHVLTGKVGNVCQGLYNVLFDSTCNLLSSKYTKSIFSVTLEVVKKHFVGSLRNY